VDNTSTKESVVVADKSEDVVGSSVAREDMTKVENEERSMPSPPVEVACTTKVEIDLMVSFRVVAFATYGYIHVCWKLNGQS